LIRSDSYRVLALYILVFISWSGAWFALSLQAGAASPLVSIALRFLLAAPPIFLLAVWRGDRLNFGGPMQLRFFAVGTMMFSINFIFAYSASAYLTSALISVVFSLSAGVNLLLTWLLKGQRPSLESGLGAVAGTIGLVLLVWTEVAHSGAGRLPLVGLGLALCMTVSFCLGSLLAADVQARGVPLMSATAWSMAWGGLVSLAASLIMGQSWAIDISMRYLGSLAFLVLFGTILGFLGYLALMARIGVASASYITTITPIGAFAISSLFEGYRWTGLSLLGLAIAVLGNVLTLRGRSAKPALQPQKAIS